MIHTIEIQSSITYKEYINLYNNNNLHFYKDTMQETKKQSIYISNSLDKINKIVIKKINVNRKKYKHSIYYINLVVNPIKIINTNYNYTGIEILENNRKDIKKFIKELDNIIKNTLNINKSCKIFKVKRIDYCKNVNLTEIKNKYLKDKNIDIVEMYLKLFKKSNISNFEKEYNTKQHRKTFQKGSFRIQNKSVTINFYNKKLERINKNAAEQQIKAAENILRIEIQCKTNKINSIKKSNNIDNILLNFLDCKIAEQVINKYYAAIIGTSDFYNKNKAITKVKQSNYKTITKKNLIDFIEFVNKYKNLTIAKEKFNNNTKFNYLSKKLQELNINLISISKNNCVSFLPNPLHITNIK